MSRYQRLFFAGAAVVWAASSLGCGSDAQSPIVIDADTAKEKGRLVDPIRDGGGKGDVATDLFELVGQLSFGDEDAGQFTEDEQFFGYTFAAPEGAIITLDNTNKGSTRALDSTLFLYGPADESGDFGDEAIVLDDDGGWGLHAKIKSFSIPEDGEYLAVLGTVEGEGRGKYRLTLECEGEQCDFPLPPVTACDDCIDVVPDCGEGDCVVEPPLVVDPTCELEAPTRCLPGEAGCTTVGGFVEVGAQSVRTSEGGGEDRFTVHLTQEPTSQVIVWVDSTKPNEAAVYPIKLLFCPAGTSETNGGCRADTTQQAPGDPQNPVEPHWARTIELTVRGVNDNVTDLTSCYNLTFTVDSSDANYQGIDGLSISGRNENVATAPDISALDGLSDEDLLLGLHQKLADHRYYLYSGHNSARTIMFSYVDYNNGVVESIYTGATIDQPRDSSRAYQMNFNTEHSWPQSQFDKVEPPKSDLHHIFPSDILSNGKRSSYSFGMVQSIAPDYPGSRLGNGAEGPLVFQPRPERRGDIARAHFYMVARYKYDATLGLVFDDDVSGANGAMNDDEESILRIWNVEDPVDDLERQRNTRIEAYQGNRNPFVDFPELADRIADF